MVDLNALTLVELKAAAYDSLAQREQCDRDLKTINDVIVRKYNEARVEPKTEDPKSEETKTLEGEVVPENLGQENK